MTIFNVLVASSTIALGVLLNGAVPANALVRSNPQVIPSGDNESSNNNNTTSVVPSLNKRALDCTHGRVGLAWAPDIPVQWMPNAIGPKVCWYHNWSPWAADSSLTGGVSFIPMLYGLGSADAFDQVTESNNYGIAMAMNE